MTCKKKNKKKLDCSNVSTEEAKALQSLTCLKFSQTLFTFTAVCTCTLHSEGPTIPTCPFHTNLDNGKWELDGERKEEKKRHKFGILNPIKRNYKRLDAILKQKKNQIILQVFIWENCFKPAVHNLFSLRATKFNWKWSGMMILRWQEKKRLS